MTKTQLNTQLNHHLITEMGFMVSDYGLQNSKPRYHMVKQKEGGSLAILDICRHCLNPFCKIINVYNDVTIRLTEIGLKCIKYIPHLAKGPTTMKGCKGAGWVRFLG